MGTLRATGLSALLTVLLASTSFAQQAQTRDGFWIGGGLGYGSLGCEGCIDRTGAPSGYLKLGTTLRQNVLLGIETNGWTKSEFGARLTMGNVSGAVYFYPMASTGLFVKGGAGYSMLDASTDVGSGSESGFGMILGAGYDVRVTRNLSITPVANWFRGAFDGGSANVLQIGVGVTSH
ncbi:MAG: outer membrane protein beta-barrel domain [Geminicoccaceae bacterium]|nr:outer membrane protein beta-barrel domain [Geminicoccaceae bacterium]